MNIKTYMQEIGQHARKAARLMARASTDDKNNALQAIATELKNSEAQLLKANQEDLQAAQRNKLDSAMLDRLELT